MSKSTKPFWKTDITDHDKTSFGVLLSDTEMADAEMGDSKTESGIANGHHGPITIQEIKSKKDSIEEPSLRYGPRDNPPFIITLMGALQHILLSLSGCLSTSMVVADVACVPFDHPIRSHLFCTTMFMVGLCTIMQTAFGVRLPIFQGPSSSFLVPLLALQRDIKWQCPEIVKQNVHDSRSDNNATMITNSSTTEASEELIEGIHWRLQEMSGALILASLIEVLMGLSGLLKILLRFIGPITIACTITLIGTSLYRLPIIYGRANFPLAIGCMVLVLIFVLYLSNVAIPLPRLGKNSEKKPRPKFHIFQLLPILLSVLIIWILTWILTVCGVFTDDTSDVSYMARADAKSNIISNSRWFQLTYPGQFGAPKVSVALTLGFLVACFSSMIESVGDYYAAQKVCQTPLLPDHAISRGILIEGIGSVLSATVGAGHATTSYSGNIAVLTLTKTASRGIMYCAGFLLVCISLLGKVGAALTTIPNPVIGGVMMVIISTLVSIGLSNLKDVDMTSSRNLLVVGVPLMAGIVIPECLDLYPNIIDTGNEEANRVIAVFLGTPMFLGGLLALLLDSTAPGSRESRGMTQWDKTHETKDNNTDDAVYSWSFYPRLLRIFPALRHLPFLPKGEHFQRTIEYNVHTDKMVPS